MSVTGGKDRTHNHIDLSKAVVGRDRAPVGVFLTREEPTEPELAEAVPAGPFVSEGSAATVPKIRMVPFETAMRLRERAEQMSLRRSDRFGRAHREVNKGAQGAPDPQAGRR